MCTLSCLPSQQNHLKSTFEECVFVELAHKKRCRFAKNTLLQNAFSEILPAAWSTDSGYTLRLSKIETFCDKNKETRYIISIPRKKHVTGVMYVFIVLSLN